MTNKRILALCVLTSFGISQAAFADTDAAAETKSDEGSMSGMAMDEGNTPGMPMGDGDMQSGMMGGDMMKMMQNMMKMHASMMGGQGGMMGGQGGMMGGQGGMMGGQGGMMGGRGGMMGGQGGMMGGQGGMMGGQGGMMGMMDRDMMAMMMPNGGPQNMPADLSAKLGEFDADADGALTLEEFEAFHMSVVRDRMVDRFQHLDADGDGQISQNEMETAGTRMGAMQNKKGGSDAKVHHDNKSE